MLDKKHSKEGIKVLHVLEALLFQAKANNTSSKNSKKDKTSKLPEDIKNRVILKMERAEIMAAMLAMK